MNNVYTVEREIDGFSHLCTPHTENVLIVCQHGFPTSHKTLRFYSDCAVNLIEINKPHLTKVQDSNAFRNCAQFINMTLTVFSAVSRDHYDVINPTTHCISAKLYDQLVVSAWERCLRVVPQVVIDTAQAPHYFR